MCTNPLAASEAGAKWIVGGYFGPNFLSLDQPHNHKPYLRGHIFFLGWWNKDNWSIKLLVFSWHPREGTWYLCGSVCQSSFVAVSFMPHAAIGLPIHPPAHTLTFLIPEEPDSKGTCRPDAPMTMVSERNVRSVRAVSTRVPQRSLEPMTRRAKSQVMPAQANS